MAMGRQNAEEPGEGASEFHAPIFYPNRSQDENDFAFIFGRLPKDKPSDDDVLEVRQVLEEDHIQYGQIKDRCRPVAGWNESQQARANTELRNWRLMWMHHLELAVRFGYDPSGGFSQLYDALDAST